MLWFEVDGKRKGMWIANTSVEAGEIDLLAGSGTLAARLSFQLASANEESALAPGGETTVGVS